MTAHEKTTQGVNDDLPVPAPELVRRWKDESGFPYPAEDVVQHSPVDLEIQASIRVALGHLDSGNPGSAIHELERIQGREIGGNQAPPNPLAHGIELVARGLLAESLGAADAAVECFEEAFALGVPSPTILGQCGGFYRRHGRFAEAYQCWSLLEDIEPGILNGLIYSLPPTELIRFSPAIVPKLMLAKRPLFFVVHPLKRQLVHQLGPDAAAAVLGQFMGQSSPWRAVPLDLASLQEFALERALVYDELAVPKHVEMAEPEFVGEESGPPITGSSRTVVCAVLPDIVVPSKSQFVLSEHRALFDYQGDELTRGPLWFDLDPAVLAAQGRRLTVLRQDESGRMPPLEEALPLVGMFTYNFAHFIIEKLFKVLACIGRPGFEHVPILVDEQMQPAQFAMLELFLGPDHPIVVIPPGGSVHVSRLWAVTSPVYWPGCEVPGSSPLPHEELADVTFLAELLRRNESALATVDDEERELRVFLTRTDERLANREEVDGWFAELGWLVVEPAELPFLEQLRLIRNAKTVAVIDGSAKYGLFFARPGLRAGLLCSSPNQGPPHEELQLFNEMMGALGHHLLALPGKPVTLDPVWAVMSPYRIEREDLVRFLEQVEALGAPGE